MWLQGRSRRSCCMEEELWDGLDIPGSRIWPGHIFLTEIKLQVIKLYMCTSHKFCLLTVLSPPKKTKTKTTDAFWLDDSLQFLFWMGPKCSHFSELPLPNFSLDDSVWFQVGWNAAFCIIILFNEAWMSVGYLLQADFWKWFSFFPLWFPLAKGGAVFVNTATCI